MSVTGPLYGLNELFKLIRLSPPSRPSALLKSFTFHYLFLERSVYVLEGSGEISRDPEKCVLTVEYELA